MQTQSSLVAAPRPTRALDHTALERLFLDARSIQRFLKTPVSDATLRQVYELAKLGPTGFNCQPARYVFVRSESAKTRLAPALSSKNREKMLAAPVTVIVAWDSQFHEHLPLLFPAYDAKALFEATPSLIEPSAKLNATLQAAYFLLAARAVGLDVGPMTGFKGELVDGEFFPDQRSKTILLANLGYGDRSGLAPRLPRLSFEDVAKSE